jgi:hypothetical protein
MKELQELLDIIWGTEEPKPKKKKKRKRKRARNSNGTYIGDNLTTKHNEAWEVSDPNS